MEDPVSTCMLIVWLCVWRHGHGSLPEFLDPIEKTSSILVDCRHKPHHDVAAPTNEAANYVGRNNCQWTIEVM